MLDQNQLITGVSVLLAFFVGYKYGLKTCGKGKNLLCSGRLKYFNKFRNFRRR